MKYLLDTHTFIWAILDPDSIPEQSRNLIKSADEVFVSPVSLLELSFKYALKKLTLNDVTPDELWTNATEAGILLLPFTAGDAVSFYKLEVIHKDPFDRMLVWLCIRNGMTLISKDRRMNAYEKYGLSLTW